MWISFLHMPVNKPQIKPPSSTISLPASNLNKEKIYFISFHSSYCHLKATSVCLSKNKNLICGTHVSKQTIYLLVLFKRLTRRWYGYIMSAHLCSDVWENCNQKTAKDDCKLARQQTQLKTQKRRPSYVPCLRGLITVGGGGGDGIGA